MANRRVNEDQNLTSALRLRLTDDEKEMLRKDAESAGISMSELVRSRYFGKKIVTNADEEMIRELRRQGGLLKHINSQSAGIYSREVENAILSIQKAIDRIANSN
jgi:hypothetical protein